MKRYVSTSFWDDEWVQSLDLKEKGLYLYLLTNPLTNIAGVYKLSPRRVTFDTGLSNSELEIIMAKFENSGKAYRHGEYIVIPSWPHHQTANVNVHRGIRRILSTLDAEMIGFLESVGYRYRLTDFRQTEDVPSVAENKPYTHALNDKVSAEKRLFLHLWQNTKDSDGHCIFQITAAIERPKDWERFWQVSPPTCEQIEKAFKNFADGINSGTIARQYIPATPDRFVLKNGISRYQDPVKDSKKKDKDMDFPDDRISL